jgi:hypothetical protein
VCVQKELLWIEESNQRFYAYNYFGQHPERLVGWFDRYMVNPGYTATDLNANSGPQTIEEGSAEIVRTALLDPPVSGKFLETGGEIPW